MDISKAVAAGLLAVSLASGIGVRPALAQDSEDRPIEVPSTAQPGDRVAVSGGGCTGDFGVATVSAETGAVVYSGRVPVATDGSWSAELTFAPDTPPGEYVLAVVCLDGNEPQFSYQPQTITITSASEAAAPASVTQPIARVAASDEPLAHTGSGTTAVVVLGATLIVLGAAVLELALRRRRPVLLAMDRSTDPRS